MAADEITHYCAWYTWYSVVLLHRLLYGYATPPPRLAYCVSAYCVHSPCSVRACAPYRKLVTRRQIYYLLFIKWSVGASTPSAPLNPPLWLVWRIIDLRRLCRRPSDSRYHDDIGNFSSCVFVAQLTLCSMRAGCAGSLLPDGCNNSCAVRDYASCVYVYINLRRRRCSDDIVPSRRRDRRRPPPPHGRLSIFICWRDKW